MRSTSRGRDDVRALERGMRQRGGDAVELRRLHRDSEGPQHCSAPPTACSIRVACCPITPHERSSEQYERPHCGAVPCSLMATSFACLYDPAAARDPEQWFSAYLCRRSATALSHDPQPRPFAPAVNAGDARMARALRTPGLSNCVPVSVLTSTALLLCSMSVTTQTLLSLNSALHFSALAWTRGAAAFTRSVTSMLLASATAQRHSSMPAACAGCYCMGSSLVIVHAHP